jgi:hypothetical protein
VALVRTDVSEKPGASFIRVTKIGDLGTTQAATSNRRTLKTPFFIVTAVKTSNLTMMILMIFSVIEDYGSGSFVENNQRS